jgi:alpha-glucosidase (family GH31 glycosyl hydrolase)
MKFLFSFIFLIGSLALAQNNQRKFISVQNSDSLVNVTVSDGTYEIKAYSDKLIETSFFPSNIRTKEPSHAVENMPNVSRNFKLIQGKDQCKLVNHDFVVQIQKNPFQISYFYKGKLVTSEKIGYEKTPEYEKISFNLTNDEILFGGGARALGMNRRGNRLQLYNRAHYGYEERSELMNYTMPMVISNRLYAIHFDNPEIGYLDLDSKKDNSLIYETIGGRKTYQVVVGDDWKDLVENETALLGRQPMPPRWMFGNFASRFGYHSQVEAEKVVEKFRKDSIPLDAIIFDLYWFGKEIQGTLGNLEFYKDSFPNPQKMIADFKANNVKTVLITEPFILTTSKKWDEAKQKNLLGTDSTGKPLTYNFYFGNTGLLDVFQPHVQDWFWNEYKKYISMGVKGFWGDLGEPEVHPSAMFHGKLRADQVHNIYGHQWAKLLADGYKKDFPNERPFTLMRSGYSGTQRYGIIPWSGDVNRTWGGLKPQMEISMQMGLQGVSYIHSDLGGFAGANDDPELYLRWLQYGVFQPVFRPHAQEEVASEPIFKDAKTKELAKKAIELRYQLLPYNYTLAFINHTKGTPLMRPVFMEDSLSDWSYTSIKHYFWGDAFFVSPITSKRDSTELGIEHVTLPNGTWFDFHTGNVEERNIGLPGKEMKGTLVKKDLTKIPVFVKSGSFVPMSEKIQSTDEFNPNQVSVHFYYDSKLKKSSGIWYDDDGLTNEAFEKQKYEMINFKFQKNTKKSIITIKKTVGKAYQSKIDSFNLIIHFDNKIPKSIKIGKQVFSSAQFLKNNYLKIPISLNSTDIKITFVD